MTKNKKQGLLFALLAYLLPFLLGGFIYYGKNKGMDISFFPQLQMLTPALGVLLAILVTEKELGKFKPVCITYLVFFILYLFASLASLSIKGFPIVLVKGILSIVQGILSSIFSIALLISIFRMPEDLRKSYQLDLFHKKRILGALGIFLLLYFFRAFVSILLEGNSGEFLSYLSKERLYYILALIVNLPLSYIFFFGEEYGWRFYLQPLLQKKFGMVKGTLMVGILWGLWHLPLNLFFYSAPGSELMSFVNQLFVCISYGIFFSFAYNYSKSIWTPVLLHYFNNNLILLFAENMDPSVIENQVLTWPSVLINGLLMLVLFGSFIFSPYNRKSVHRRPDLKEIQEDIEKLEVPHEKIEK